MVPGYLKDFVACQSFVNRERRCRDFCRRQNAMGNLVNTTSEPMLGGMLASTSSSRMMQDANAATWPSMSSNRSDSYSSNKLEPLDRPSRPIFSADPLAFKRDPTSNAISFVIHVVAITLILMLALKARTSIELERTTIVTPVEFKLTVPPMIMPVAKASIAGGSPHVVVEPRREPLPTVERAQVMPAQIIRIDRPKLSLEPTEQVKMPDSNALPTFGVSRAPQIAMASQAKASGSGLGGGLGAGHGAGLGYGGGLMSVGGGVSAPQVIHAAEPEFTEGARQANFQGNVSIRLIVDSQGNPQDISLLSHLGMGLDEKAIEAVRQYKFRPAMFQGHPVSVQIVLDVAFHLH
jgi:periplasmic protein TonB